MERLLRLILITDDKEYASAFAEAVAATQGGVSVGVVGLVEYRAGRGAIQGGILLVDEGQGADGEPCAAVCGGQDVAHVGSLLASASAAVLGLDAQASELAIFAGGAGEPCGRVGKYAGAGRICAEARLAASLSFGSAGAPCAIPFAAGLAEVVSVLGIEGGAGASSIALGLAGELSAYHGKRVLYLSMEAFESPSLGVSARMSGGKAVSLFLFHFLRSRGGELGCGGAGESSGSRGGAGIVGGRQGGASLSASPFVSRDDYGVMRFAPSRGRNCLCELSGGELGQFVSEAAGELRPDYIFLDWGSYVGRDAAAWLACSSLALFVMRHDGVKSRIPAGAAASDSEDATVITELAAELGVCLDKAVFVVNRQPPELVDGLPGRFVGISDDPYAFERDGDRVSISLATAFGTGIKALAEMALSGGERGGGAEAVIEAAGEALDKRKIGNGKQDEYFAA